MLMVRAIGAVRPRRRGCTIPVDANRRHWTAVCKVRHSRLPTSLQLLMVAPAIQTGSASNMAYCKLCIPGMRQNGFRLANPLPTYVACIPFVPTVATGYAATYLYECAPGRHLGTGIRTSNSEES
jgi:hypothetical protein